MCAAAPCRECGRPEPRTDALANAAQPRPGQAAGTHQLRHQHEGFPMPECSRAWQGTRCLLIGAGTLGCQANRTPYCAAMTTCVQVARNLMAWGVRKITFVDSGKVKRDATAAAMSLGDVCTALCRSHTPTQCARASTSSPIASTAASTRHDHRAVHHCTGSQQHIHAVT